MIEVWLYGKLRRLAPEKGVAANSIVQVPTNGDETIQDILAHLGIAQEETSNIFQNGQLSVLERHVQDGDRLGVFPDDMSLLYKWYFTKKR
jgi:hypothetical protein